MSEPAGAVFGKLRRRILPLLTLCYFVAFIDRVNVGFAQLGMKQDLGLSPVVYGWGAGIFVFDYFLFEVPSNLILERVGARRWIARIMVTWGILSISLTYWFPRPSAPGSRPGAMLLMLRLRSQLRTATVH